jgi:hypothetical protein
MKNEMKAKARSRWPSLILFSLGLFSTPLPQMKRSYFEMKLSGILTLTTAVAVMAIGCMDTRAQSSASPPPSNHMTSHHAKGTFEVTMKPLTLGDAGASDKFARMSLDKQFAGDLVGTGKGEMLSAQTDVKGSAGYVAIEKVVGTLEGHKGTFVFQHSGTMNRGVPQLTITVVPDSGTEGLIGIAGTFRIEIKDSKHFYDFEYTLP